MQGLPLFAARRRNFFLYIIAIALPLVFLVTMLSQNVFAQNTFVITDGDQVIVHTTYASDPAMALNEAGVDVEPDEYITTQTEDGVYDITVQRDDAVTVVNCGEEMKVQVKFRQDCGQPKGENCPCIIIVPKTAANLAENKFETSEVSPETGEVKIETRKNYVLWVSEWKPGREYVDTSLDDFED